MPSKFTVQIKVAREPLWADRCDYGDLQPSLEEANAYQGTSRVIDKQGYTMVEIHRYCPHMQAYPNVM